MRINLSDTGMFSITTTKAHNWTLFLVESNLFPSDNCEHRHAYYSSSWSFIKGFPHRNCVYVMFSPSKLYVQVIVTMYV